MTTRRIGVHTSIAGGIYKSIERALELNCNTLQIFSHNPRGWKIIKRHEDEVREFINLKKRYDIHPIFIHASYLINLASSDSRLRQRSADMVIEELNVADMIGADYVVLHSGSASQDDPRQARLRLIECLKDISLYGQWNAGILIENTAGGRGDVTSKIADIAEIINEVSGSLISGICLDTCHAFAAGYDIRYDSGIDLLISEISKHLSINRLKLIHLNDSKALPGAGIDRHEHLGKGNIGEKGLKRLVTYRDLLGIPIILETPKKSDMDDRVNLSFLKGLIN